ncbi:MAG: hypothetical protein J7641_13345 [Cyanobacteria bacterium SID2]|nr:hypothetical protein [Cyanobacteria bacterium SID2]MBP0006625.1 hypothetical protein [Cyanobacteria bacterium SBC]
MENTLIVTESGGLPPDPMEVLRSQSIWSDMRLSEILEPNRAIERLPNEAEDQEESFEPPSLVEATGWQHHEERVSNRWFDPTCR